MPAEESAAGGTRDDELIEEAIARIKVAVGAAFSVAGAGSSMRQLERAGEVVERIGSPEARDFVRAWVEVMGAYLSALVELGEGGDLVRARQRFTRAGESLENFRATYSPPPERETDLDLLALSVEQQLLKLEIAVADEDERPQLVRREKRVGDEVIALSGPFGEAIQRARRQLANAAAAFKRADEATAQLDLATARRYSEEATEAMAAVGEALDAAEAINEDAVGLSGDVMRAYGPLVEAQHAYVCTLHDAIVGEARGRHAADLERADRLLRDGVEDLVERVEAFDRQWRGVLQEPVDLEGLHQGAERQRENMRNLRALLDEAASPRQAARRAAPRFVVYFLLTFVVLLFGARVSGIVPELGGAEVVAITGLALVAAAAGSFGLEAALAMAAAARGPAREPGPQAGPFVR
ncbi:MAG TPA: hypothetical protein VD704_03520 [Gaiellaceae bacterium]|nr:hypothetical protein [Gaiellaceae bacterium]